MERIVTIYPVFVELIQQIGVKIGYRKVMILSTCRLVQKMENWGEDWIWHVRIYSTCWINCQNSMKNGKYQSILDMSSWHTLHMQGTSCLIVLIFECAQNMEIGMNRYTAFVSLIAGIAPFIRVKECWVGGRCRKVTLGRSQ